MNDYCGLALDYLRLAFDPHEALFSYSSTLGAGARVVNDFRRPESLRYTINAYLGLSEAERHRGPIDWLGPLHDRVHEFLALHESELRSPADLGLLLVLLAAADPAHPAGERALERIERATAPGADRPTAPPGLRTRKPLNMQDLAWMLWGATAWPDRARSAAAANSLFELIRTRYVHPATGLPRHSLARYRAHTVSFGSIVYYLRALHEYGEAFDSDEARELFARATRHVLALQGDDGAWPWMIDVRSALPFDRYPIFTVHQDSMAMLFLFPAAERHAVPGAPAAAQRSLRWNLGHNELGAPMVLTEPHPWIYRSIERSERAPRLRRYLRGLGAPPRAVPKPATRLRINRECRSYHLGWVLYAWSDPARAPALEAALSPAPGLT